MPWTFDEPQPVAIVDPATGTAAPSNQGVVDAINSMHDDLLVPVTSQPPVLPEPLSSTNDVRAIKLSGASPIALEALDADEAWDVVGWSISFSAACIFGISMDDDDAALQYTWDIPAAGIWDREIGSFAKLTGNIGEPITVTYTAGTPKGVIYVRKHL